MTESNAAAVAADSLGLHMLREIVDEFQQLPGFQNLTSAQQSVHIERLDKSVRRLIAEALGIMFSAEYPACVATLDRIVIGKDIIGRFNVERSSESRHELMDRAGQKVVVVMADPDRYYQRMTEVKARADQGDLFHDPSQPLGHMGVDTPPSKPDDTAAEDVPGSGVDDVMPEKPESDAPIDIVTPDSVWAALDSIAGKFSLFRDEGGDITPAAATPSNEIEKAEAKEPVPAADDIVGITAALKARGVKIKGKEVSRWSQSQRVAAVSWLAGRSSHRPEFIPAPTPPDAPSEAAGA